MTSPDVAVSAAGLLAEFNQAGVITALDVHVAQTLLRLGGSTDELVALAIALSVRALRLGSTCLDLMTVRETAIADLADPALPSTAGAAVASVEAQLAWPVPSQWVASLRSSALVATDPAAPINAQPLRLTGTLLQLERSWVDEQIVLATLRDRQDAPPPEIDQAALDAAIATFVPMSSDLADASPSRLDLAAPDANVATFPPKAPGPAGAVDVRRSVDDAAGGGTRALAQAEAIRMAVGSWASVIAGGPGTGKTTTVARLLAVLHRLEPGQRIALAAPSGKAAARLQQAILEATRDLSLADALPPIPTAVTLHRLLGARGPGGSFAHGRSNPLPHSLVVVDEMSMVALPLMARLCEALRPEARLVMIGDPHQLTSVDAGAVLADVVAACPHQPGQASKPSVIELTHNWRFGGAIRDLATAIRQADADAALAVLAADAGSPSPSVSLVEADAAQLRLADLPPEVTHPILSAGRAMLASALSGDAVGALGALDRHRLLCAHREGAYGVARWGAMLQDAVARSVPAADRLASEWFPGRPVLITENAPALHLSNGDSGVVIVTESGLRAAIGDAGNHRLISPFMLDAVSSLWAMTVHKAQGSQFDHVTVILPPPGSALLTRELLYTAVTRARHRVTLIGTPDAVRLAVTTQARRASALEVRWRALAATGG